MTESSELQFNNCSELESSDFREKLINEIAERIVKNWEHTEKFATTQASYGINPKEYWLLREMRNTIGNVLRPYFRKKK